MPRMPSEERVGVFRLILWLLWAAIVVVVPSVGVWTASSLAAYRNGPVWLVCLAGLLLFPVLPLLWEARAARRRAKRGGGAKPALTFGDRLVLRTLAVNVLFLGVLLAAFPAGAFAALSTRGDWFLEGRSGPRVTELRARLFQAASGLEWLYRRARRNPYEKELDPGSLRRPDETPVAAVVERQPLPEAPVPVLGGRRGGVMPEAPVDSFAAGGPPSWPLPAELAPVVARMGPADETSLAAVARAIGAAETDPWRRVKALHDWVADRVAYDVEALKAAARPPQDAESVFRTRKAVCAGYANLLAAMGEVTGDEIRVVPGDARQRTDDLTGSGHAWNAARIDGRWVLVDATWDAGSIGEDGFTKRYGTRYLFVPPEVMGVTHFPEDPAWQLRQPPLARGEFFRQPVLRAGFFADGLQLVSPDRSQVTVDREVEVVLRNPRGRSLLSDLEPLDGGKPVDCRVTPGSEPRIDCTLPGRGRHRLRIFSAAPGVSWHDLVGEIEVNGTGG